MPTLPSPRPLRAAAVFAASMLAGFALVAAALGQGRPQERDLAALKAAFARPTFVPHPADNLPSPAKIVLGQRLFEDKRISATGTVSCASCHDARLSYADGEVTGIGVSGRRLGRHSPTLWNSAFAPLLFWDGRAESLEDQVRFPIAHPDEMGGSLERAVERFQDDAEYRAAFAAVFGDAKITPDRIAKAIAAFERTLVSPATRFDRWIAGDDGALSAAEVRGFELFTGRARCSACHAGFAFTDHGFYDIGLPSQDGGRGTVIGLPAAKHAFKTPTLRELAWTAPYMHDGSLATLEDVIRHYETGGIQRPTLSQDMPKGLRLSDAERADLLAFLDTLSSETPPRPSTESWVLAGGAAVPAQTSTATTTVQQREKQFMPGRISMSTAETLTILNDDTRTHNVRIFDPRFDFNSGAQEPSQSVTIRFPAAGTFDAFCGIHPAMRLRIEVN